MLVGHFRVLRATKARVDFALCVTLLMCTLKVSFESTVTPRYFADETKRKGWQWIVYSAQITFFLFRVMRITSHLSVLNIICHLASHFCKLLRSDWRMLVSWVVLICLYKRQSSANNHDEEAASGKSLIWNSRGPRTVPCGTPLITGWGDEVDPSQRTLWVLFDKNADIHFKMSPLTPYKLSLCSRRWCGILSNALLKSSKTASICQPSSKPFARSCIATSVPYESHADYHAEYQTRQSGWWWIKAFRYY